MTDKDSIRIFDDKRPGLDLTALRPQKNSPLRMSVAVMTGLLAAGTAYEAIFGARTSIVLVGLALTAAGMVLTALWETR